MKIKIVIWIIIVIPLLIVNSVPIGFTLFSFMSLGWAILLLPSIAANFSYILLPLAVIDFIVIFHLMREYPNGLVNKLCHTSLILPTILLILSYYGFMDILRKIPIRVSREEALKHINNCDVYSLEKEPGNARIRITFPNGRVVNVNGADAKEYKIYVIANSDFEFLRDAASAVKERCGYRVNDDVFPGFDGFKNN